ncbi:MAG: hypothetical protein OXG44_09195 [Gammaproteobacteria bacterium]|nr:hypothetical protein [Gammaproteobacteria bacterium]
MSHSTTAATWSAVCQCCAWREDGHAVNSDAADAAARHVRGERCGGHSHRVAVIEACQ